MFGSIARREACYRAAVTLVMFVTMLLTGGALYASDYYVAVSGNDTTGTGTKAQPWATITKADKAVMPGDTVHVGPGKYTDSVHTSHSGTAESPIIYISDVKWGASINVTNDHAIWRNSGDYVYIEQFDVTSPDPSLNGAMYALANGGSHCKIIGNHIHDVPAANGLVTGWGGAGIENGNYSASDNDVFDNVVNDIGPKQVNSLIHGIYLANKGGHCCNNFCYSNSGWGIHTWHGAEGAVISNNLCFNNLRGGILIGSGEDGARPTSGDYFTVTNNICIYNGGPDYKWYKAYPITESGQTGPHNVYINNLCYGNTHDNLSEVLKVQPIGTIFADPKLINYKGDGSGDYHLSSQSPCIDAGTKTGAPSKDYDGVIRPQGKGYDIGPYEYTTHPVAGMLFSK